MNFRMLPDEWNRVIATFPNAHVLQSDQWGQVKSRVGWEVEQLVWNEGGQRAGELPGQMGAVALVLKRKLPMRGFADRLNVLYVPKGPLLLDWSNASLRKRVLHDLMEYAHRKRAIFIKIDPDVPLGYGVPGSPTATDDDIGLIVLKELESLGWRFSREQVQFCNTMVIDLTQPEDVLLGAMKAKARYNIRLSERKGVVVRAGSLQDLPMLYKMYAETSIRDKFVIRDEAYYRMNWSIFLESRMAEALIAEVEREPVAGLILYYFEKRAWFLFGMSSNFHRDKMPNYLLQWEAIHRAKARGCQVYDLWGAPDTFKEDDPMYGVYRFKEGLGAEVVRYIGAWDYAARPFYYYLYVQLLPRLLDIMRSRGISRTKAFVSPG